MAGGWAIGQTTKNGYNWGMFLCFLIRFNKKTGFKMFCENWSLNLFFVVFISIKSGTGHEIHLEIEDVLYKKMLWLLCHS